MRVLVTWGSTRGGTEGIARILGEALRRDDIEVDILPPGEAARATRFDAAVVGGALYANRWHNDARRFVNRQEKRLRGVPVWFFSSGPLDDSADREELAPPRQVEILMERVGAQGHRTFGGRLAPDARGFPASAMAKEHAGDWRNTKRVRAWADEIARVVATARPRVPVEHAGRSLPWLLLHGIAGASVCAALMALLLGAGASTAAIVIHALAAPMVFAWVAVHYFGARGARDPLPTALTFTGLMALFELAVVAGLVQGSLDMLRSVVGSWLPFALVFAVTWAIGEIMSMMPFPKLPANKGPGASHPNQPLSPRPA